MSGKVYLVGAGPGDPDLITVKGRECIRRAEVVIYDYLAAEQLLADCSGTAETIYVGKKGGDHTLSQDEINALIVEKAREGRVVTRLKGGDPFIFGRGGEEAEVLVQENIAFEIVPGVTSAIAAPAYAGIPLTHRDHASAVTLVTGHENPEKEQSSINWPALASIGGTLVFLMGVKNLPQIAANLRENGLPGTTPVALVRWGTTPAQKTLTGTLADIAEKVARSGFTAPCIIVVGSVVSLRQTLHWYEDRPLLGKKIVVTRARPQASGLTRLLTEYGAECLECPTIRIAPPDDWSLLDRCLEVLPQYDWLAFTSVNGVAWFFHRLREKGLDSRALGHLKTAVIGPATEKKLGEYGLAADILPDSYRAEAVVAAFRDYPLEGRKILLPRAAEARPVLPEELTKMGAAVDEVPVYYTRRDRSAADKLLTALENREVDLVTFTSSSTVKNFRSLLPESAAERLLAGVAIAVIGPITAETAAEEGLTVHIAAEDYTIEGLCQAILTAFAPA